MVVGTKLLADPNTWCQLLCQKIQRNRFLFSKLKRDAITEATICSVWRFLGWPNYFWASNTIWRARSGLKICWSLPNKTEHFSAMTIFQMAGPEGEQICWSENLLIWAILLILGAAEHLLIRQIWPIWAGQTLKVVPLHNFCTKENWKWIWPWSMKIALFSVLGRNGWGWAFFLSSICTFYNNFLMTQPTLSIKIIQHKHFPIWNHLRKCSHFVNSKPGTDIIGLNIYVIMLGNYIYSMIMTYSVPIWCYTGNYLPPMPPKVQPTLTIAV